MTTAISLPTSTSSSPTTTPSPLSARLPIVLAIAIVAGTFWFSPNYRRVSGPDAPPFAGDFTNEWLGGYIVRTGDYTKFYNVDYAIQLQHDPAIVGYEWKRTEYLPIVYPPFYYLLLSPLSCLPLRTAAVVWAVLMTAALVATIWLVLKVSSWKEGCLANWLGTADSPEGELYRRDASDSNSATNRALWLALAPWLLPIAMFFAPLLENLVSSQKGTVCLLILTSTFLLLDTRRPFAAGLVFGLLAFKPQLTLVIAFSMLFKREWRFIAGGAITGCVLGGLSLVLGMDVCRQFYRFSTGMADYIYNQGYDLTKSHCLYGFFAMLLGAKNALLVRGATTLASIGVIGALAALLRGKLDYGRPTFAFQFAGLVLASLLLSPHLFGYDLTMLLLPMFLLLVPRIRQAAPPTCQQPLLWLTALIFAAAGFSQEIAIPTHVQVTTILMIWLLVVLVRSRRPGLYCRLGLDPALSPSPTRSPANAASSS